MKKLGLLLMLLLAMTMKSHHVFAQSVTITLMPGWNWISIPQMDTLDFETALGSFTPVTGDMIKSQWGNASFRADGHWRGQIFQFYPGYGYKYYSNRMMPVMVTFQAQQPAPQGDVHEYVDLGLPGGTLWATCNVGANAPEEYGDYFAWGETTPKDIYNWDTYQYANGSSLEDPQLTKYCNNAEFGYNGFTDNLTTLLPEDDAATVNWGENWRMPTSSEYEELFNHTTFTGTVRNGVTGFLFTASNGNSIFLPVTGSISYDNVIYGNTGEYWSNTLLENPNYAGLLFFYSESFGSNIEMANAVRCYGRPVRPIRSTPQNNAPIGAINGKFTINADGNQVYFSQGNLQYQASTNTWRFAENQWDYVGEDNSNISQTYDGWIDLFGWGTSGYNHGAVCYQPWSTSQNVSGYYAYGSSTYNLYDQTGQADWGYNPINNGGNTANLWNTLTTQEWQYNFETRTTMSGIRYTKAQVNNVNGVILLPDNWSNSTYSLSNTNNCGASYSSNVISVSQWTTLENAGAIFLPAAGSRIITSVYNVDANGNYWSTSYGNSSYTAYHVYFNGLYLGIGGDYRSDGYSVRLVRFAEN